MALINTTWISVNDVCTQAALSSGLKSHVHISLCIFKYKYTHNIPQRFFQIRTLQVTYYVQSMGPNEYILLYLRPIFRKKWDVLYIMLIVRTT